MSWCDATGLIDHVPLESFLQRPLTDRERDLLSIASVALSVDRTHARSRENWRRSLVATFPVRNPRFWSDHAAVQLHALLEWMSGDDWTFDFVPGRYDRTDAEAQVRMFRPSSPSNDEVNVVALHSGGLDSAAGVIGDPLVSNADTVTLVSAWTNRRMDGLQRDIAGAMRSGFRPLRHVSAEIRSVEKVAGRQQVESSQRARAFAYFAVGLVVANSLRANELRVYENGIGAVNLPYVSSQTGSRMSRAMHPNTLRLASELASAIFGGSLSISNPAVSSLKSDMVSAVPDRYWSILAATVSCDTAFAHRGPGGRHLCGECGSCLLRLQALFVAEDRRPDPARGYRFDLMGGADLGLKRADRFSAIDLQATRIRRALEHRNPVAALVEEFAMLADLDTSRPRTPTSVRDAIDQFIPLLRGHVDEWDAFASHAFGRARIGSGDGSTARIEQLQLPEAIAVAHGIGGS